MSQYHIRLCGILYKRNESYFFSSFENLMSERCWNAFSLVNTAVAVAKDEDCSSSAFASCDLLASLARGREVTLQPATLQPGFTVDQALYASLRPGGRRDSDASKHHVVGKVLTTGRDTKSKHSSRAKQTAQCIRQCIVLLEA